MPLNFPNSPTNGQLYTTDAGVSYKYDSNVSVWLVIGSLTNFISNVVISVADSTNAALRITQTGTAPAIRVEDDTNPDSTPFVVDATGNVLVGRTTSTVGQSVLLDVAGAINASSILVNGTALGSGGISLAEARKTASLRL